MSTLLNQQTYYSFLTMLANPTIDETEKHFAAANCIVFFQNEEIRVQDLFEKVLEELQFENSRQYDQEMCKILHLTSLSLSEEESFTFLCYCGFPDQKRF